MKSHCAGGRCRQFRLGRGRYETKRRSPGNIDGAFNNAGIGIDTLPLEAVEEAEFDRIVSINMKGVWLCMKSQLPHMKSNGGGAIVNNASVAGLVGLAMQGHTAAPNTQSSV